MYVLEIEHRDWRFWNVLQILELLSMLYLFEKIILFVDKIII